MERTTRKRKVEISKGLLWAGFALLLAVVIVVAVLVFLRQNTEQIRQQNMIYIENTAQQTARRVDDILLNAEHSAATMAKLYGEMMTSSEPDLALLEDIANDTLFDYVEYADTTGTNHTTDGSTADVSDREYFQKALAGEECVDVVYDSRISNQTLVVFAAPLYYQDEIVGVLLAGYEQERLQTLMEETYFGESSVSYLCESDGTVITHSGVADEVENILDFYDETRLSGDEWQALSEALSSHASCGFTVAGNDGETNSYLAQLSEVDWCIVQTFPSSVATERINALNHTGLVLILCVAAAFAAYILLIFFVTWKKQRLILREKDEMESIVDGVNRLFARFVIVNLEKNTYRYLVDYSGSPSSLPREGKYDDFVRYFQGRILETTGDDKLEDVLSPDFLLKHLASEPYISYNFRIRRGSADHWENASFICLSRKNARPRTLLFAIQDVTELHHRDEKQQEALAAAFQAATDASNAKSDFLSRMSHDMRTPMNAVLGMTQIAKSYINKPDRVMECLDKISSSGKHLLSLINEVLDLSKIVSSGVELHKNPFSLRECLDGVADEFRAQIQEKQLTFVFPGDDIRHDHVYGDTERLRRILINILENAVKYTPAGGTITLSAREREGDAEHTAVYEFCCEDTGVGIPAEYLEEIFEPFVCASDSRTQRTEDVGLGLPIARGFARMMDGDIRAQSTPGKGSRFTVTVQLELVDKPLQAAQQTEPEEPRFDGHRVLLVEDIEMNAEIAAEFLGFFGIETDIAENGKIALDLLLSKEPCPYDMIFMDLQMPVMNGFEATEAIRAAGRADLREIPIVALTANAFQEDINRAFASGMNAHLTKPISHAKLAETLQKYIHL